MKKLLILLFLVSCSKRQTNEYDFKLFAQHFHERLKKVESTVYFKEQELKMVKEIETHESFCKGRFKDFLKNPVVIEYMKLRTGCPDVLQKELEKFENREIK